MPADTRPRVDAHSLGSLCIYATRYALGRRSTAPGTVADVVRQCWASLDHRDRLTLLRDLREAIADDDRWLDGPEPRDPWSRPLGGECDSRTWRDLLAWMVDGGADAAC